MPLAQLTQTQAIEVVRGGDSAAFESIMRKHNQRLFRLIRSIVRDDAMARDILQDSYVLAYTRLNQFKGPLGFSAWLSRIAKNQALSFLRKNKRWVVMDKDTLETINVQPKADGPEEVLARKDLGHALEKEIDRLGDSFRSVFILRGVEKMSVRETAEALELSEGTVRTQYHRARQALQRGIEERMAEAQDGVFEFAGTWCDSVVETVLKRIVSINIEDVRQ